MLSFDVLINFLILSILFQLRLKYLREKRRRKTWQNNIYISGSVTPKKRRKKKGKRKEKEKITPSDMYYESHYQKNKDL